MTTGALLDLGAMFGAFQLEGRQVEDLAAFKIDGGHLGKILAAGAFEQGMNLGVLGLVTEREGAAGVAGLATGFAARLLAQAFGSGPLPIRRGGARAVGAILGMDVAQTLHLGLERQGMLDQAGQVGLAPGQQFFPALNDRGLGAHEPLRGRGKSP